MIHIENTTEFQIEADTVVTIGKFDGIHKGHAMILHEVMSQKKQGLLSAVFTFDTPPTSIFLKENQRVLTTNTEKRAMFEQMGVDALIEFPFYEKTAAISAESFIEDILVGMLHAKVVVVGTDCRFGHRGAGTYRLLQQYGSIYGYQTIIIEKECYLGQEISSSRIRTELEHGSITEVNQMLYQPYTIYGEVIHGRKLGRTLGMPTVNQLPEMNKLLPQNGVYYSRVYCQDQWYDGITNVGCKPTVSGDDIRGVETYIYDFDQNVYGNEIRVSLLQFARPEQRFASVEELKQQMLRDIENGRKWHAKQLKSKENVKLM